MKDLSSKISVAFFAFNQEMYVREAVQGILGQETEAPLQVILSDDCSKDATYKVMEAVVAAYDGPHAVILRKNQINLGLAVHVNTVLGMCTGEWMMLAAGDDISNPKRAQSLINLINTVDDPELMAIQGGYYEIDPDGNITSEVPEPDLPHVDPIEYVKADGYVVGATMCYRRKLVDDFPPLGDNVGFEDRVFGFRALLCGKIINLPKPLVQYRRDVPTSLSTGDRRSYDHGRSVRFQANRYSGLKHVAEQYLRDLKRHDGNAAELHKTIHRKIQEYRFYESVYSRRPLHALVYGFCGFIDQKGLKKTMMGVARSIFYLLISIRER